LLRQRNSKNIEIKYDEVEELIDDTSNLGGMIQNRKMPDSFKGLANSKFAKYGKHGG